MGRIVRVEWRKLLRWRLFRGIFLAGCGLQLFWIAFAAYMVERGSPSVREGFVQRLTWPGVVPQSFTLSSGFGESFLAILAAAFIANEFSWGTWRLLLPTGFPRWQFVLGKVGALLIAGSLFVIGTALVPLLATPLVVLLLDLPLRSAALPDHWLLEYALLPVRASLSLIAPIVLGMALALLTRSQAVAVGIAIGGSMAEEIAAGLLRGLGGWWAELPRFFYLTNARVLARTPLFGGAPEEHLALASPAESLLVVVLWTVGLIVFMMWWFQRRDIEVRGAS